MVNIYFLPSKNATTSDYIIVAACLLGCQVLSSFVQFNGTVWIKILFKTKVTKKNWGELCCCGVCSAWMGGRFRGGRNNKQLLFVQARLAKMVNSAPEKIVLRIYCMESAGHTQCSRVQSSTSINDLASLNFSLWAPLENSCEYRLNFLRDRSFQWISSTHFF